jgi:hypothetical protein
MRRMQMHALQKALKDLQIPSVDSCSYDENMKRTEAPQLVEGIPNVDLLSDVRFKEGYKRCYDQMAEYISFILSATDKELVKYAGKPEKVKKEG